jgi:hypothetical protein
MSTEMFKGIFFTALAMLTALAIVGVTASDFRHDIVNNLPIRVNGKIFKCVDER